MFPEIPTVLRVSSGNPEWRLIIPWRLGILMGCRNVGYSRVARSFRIMKFSCVIQGIQLVLQVLNLSHKLIYDRRILSLWRRALINLHLSGSICFFATDSSQFLHLLAIFCAIFLKNSISHISNSKWPALVPLSLISELVRLMVLRSMGVCSGQGIGAVSGYT